MEPGGAVEYGARDDHSAQRLHSILVEVDEAHGCGVLAQVGVEIALGFLALLGIVGVLVAEALPEVTRPG